MDIVAVKIFVNRIYGAVAEWPNARDCKSLKSGVRIPPALPVLWLVSVTVAQWPPHPLDGVQFPDGSPHSRF